MTKMTYKEQLLHPNWQRKRLECLESAGFACESCGDTETTLHVHHKRYAKGRMVWEYERGELAVLCQPCHQKEHAHRELLDRLLAVPDAGPLLEITVAMLAGYLDAGMNADPDLTNEGYAVYAPAYLAGMIACYADGASFPRMLKAVEILAPAPTSPAKEWLLSVLRGE